MIQYSHRSLRAQARLGAKALILAALLPILLPVQAVTQVAPSGAAAPPGGLLPPSLYLPERPGFTSWKLLGQVSLTRQNNRLIPNFSADILALDGKVLRFQGFMMPLDIGERQRRFLLTAAPPHCAFCLPAGPESMLEVRAKDAVRYTIDAVQLSGKLQILRDDPAGLYYRLVDAEAIRP